MILLLHHRYRRPGGEERTVADLAWLIRERLGEDVTILERDSARTGAGAAAAGLVGGGLHPEAVAHAVRETGARVVHVHNLHPTLGPRALQAAHNAGARVVLHLHNYRLVCAVATCFTHGEDCTRCRGRRTWPGVRLHCRGGSHAEDVAYAVGLARWQDPVSAAVDAFAAPSAAALARLRELRAPLDAAPAHVLPPVQRAFAPASAAHRGRFALVAGRLSPEKGVADAIQACARARVPLVVAGDGPQRAELGVLARGRDVRFTGHLDATALADLRAQAALALVPSRWAEVFGLAALEAMAAGVPVVAARAGGLPEVVPAEGLHPPGDVPALAERIVALYGDASAGERALAAARARHAPEVVAPALAALYAG